MFVLRTIKLHSVCLSYSVLRRVDFCLLIILCPNLFLLVAYFNHMGRFRILEFFTLVEAMCYEILSSLKQFFAFSTVKVCHRIDLVWDKRKSIPFDFLFVPFYSFLGHRILLSARRNFRNGMN